MTKIYLAGPFFDDEQIERISRMEEALTANPTVASFFSPRKEEFENRVMGTPEWAADVFEMDRVNIDNADVVTAVIDYEGTYVDPGTAWEIGYANAMGKPVLLIKEKAEGSVNLMMGIPAHGVLTDVAEIANYDFNEMPRSSWQGDMF
ncbi:nucleoside 2-deoxyribosyltransferase [Weissella tructae]|uniref:Purine deoxyribosyltransferase n=2 Tax=Weissella TaxID=46255 RepID=A0A075TZI6_9LACO|nr:MULTISPECIES: nucleoside 2-deoxyribosyltransferase [Weissella]AIG65303.1 Purine deoxyribosyltransferase [Weissella tructae]AIM62617.1 Purine deoxyribosyltransferase [Weissella ceti]AIM63952.1 Purine deoxyribosyltransferase [Weissella ceti]ELA07708.1 purine deoxyribosyltransferase [Weissella ceti NC36]QVV91685.1 nucleoside 2-deoxyribosyltransferase [Weissella tructae]